VDAIDLAASRSSLPLLASGVGDFKHLQRRLLMIRSRQGNRKMGWTALVACAAMVALPLSLTRAKQAAPADVNKNAKPNERPATQPGLSAEELRTLDRLLPFVILDGTKLGDSLDFLRNE